MNCILLFIIFCAVSEQSVYANSGPVQAQRPQQQVGKPNIKKAKTTVVVVKKPPRKKLFKTKIIPPHQTHLGIPNTAPNQSRPQNIQYIIIAKTTVVNNIQQAPVVNPAPPPLTQVKPIPVPLLPPVKPIPTLPPKTPPIKVVPPPPPPPPIVIKPIITTTTPKPVQPNPSTPKNSTTNSTTPIEEEEAELEHPPSEEAQQLVDKYSAEIKEKSLLQPEEEDDKKALAEAPIEALAMIKYKEGGLGIFLIKICIGQLFILHIKVSKRTGMDISGSTLVGVAPDKDDPERLIREEFESAPTTEKS